MCCNYFFVILGVLFPDNKKYNKCSFVLLCCIFICLTACQEERQRVFYDLSFEEIAEKANSEQKKFCLVLSEGSCPSCENYMQLLSGRYRQLTKQAIFNIVNTSLPENKWYRYWSCSMASPMTCVFSASGDLEAIISGANANCFDCIALSIGGNVACSVYTYRTPFTRSDNQKEIIKALGVILKSNLRLNRGENIDTEIAQTRLTVEYPYNLYLQAINADRQGDNENAVYLAMLARATKEESIIYRRLYTDLFTELQFLINPDYDPIYDPVLRVDSVIKLSGCLPHVPKPFLVNLTNTGRKELIIEEVSLSCDCVSLKSAKDIRLKPDETRNVQFEFIGEKEGTFTRYITLCSNAINPIVLIEINAIVE